MTVTRRKKEYILDMKLLELALPALPLKTIIARPRRLYQILILIRVG